MRLCLLAEGEGRRPTCACCVPVVDLRVPFACNACRRGDREAPHANPACSPGSRAWALTRRGRCDSVCVGPTGPHLRALAPVPCLSFKVGTWAPPGPRDVIADFIL
jgi:hypothetical protein